MWRERRWGWKVISEEEDVRGSEAVKGEGQVERWRQIWGRKEGKEERLCTWKEKALGKK